MIGNHTPARAVIAEHNGPCVTKFSRHWLTLDGNVQIAELCFHVRQTLVANRTLVRDRHVLVVAFLVYTVTADHEHDRSWRGEQIFTADGAVTVRRAFDALVRRLNIRRYARAACEAVEKVLPDAVPFPTNATIVAVINGFILTILPQLADATVVVR